MARKRLTQLFPFLLPLRIWQRNLFYQIGMKFDGNKYSKSFGEKTSILLEVVGPQLPIANPFGVGVGPAKYCTAPFIS